MVPNLSFGSIVGEPDYQATHEDTPLKSLDIRAAKKEWILKN